MSQYSKTEKSNVEPLVRQKGPGDKIGPPDRMRYGIGPCLMKGCECGSFEPSANPKVCGTFLGYHGICGHDKEDHGELIN